MKIKKNPVYISKQWYEQKHIDLSLIAGKGKKHHVLINDLDTFMNVHTLHRGKNIFAVTVYKLFSKEEILKRHIKDCF